MELINRIVELWSYKIHYRYFNTLQIYLKKYPVHDTAAVNAVWNSLTVWKYAYHAIMLQTIIDDRSSIESPAVCSIKA